jgi:glycosyltransferase involved in cell wall biosynthesis
VRCAYICADSGVPIFGTKGCSIHVQELIHALLDARVEVCLFASRIEGNIPRTLQKLSICAIPKYVSNNTLDKEELALATNQQLPSLLSAEGPFDFVYERYSLWSFAGIEWAASRGIPAIVEVNAPLIDEQKKHRQLIHHEIARQSSSRALGSATAIIAVSRKVAEYASSFTTPERIHVIPNGVTPRRFPREIEPLLKRSSDSFVIGFLGTLKPWHDLSTLVEAFSIVRKENPKTRLLIVGDGPQRKCLEQRLLDTKMREFVDFTGTVPAHEVPRLLASMDAALVPYAADTEHYFSPLKLFEYMAARLAIVAADIGQIKETIMDKEDGLLYTPGDAISLAEKIFMLIQDPILRKRLGEAARKKVLGRYTWGHVVREVLQIANIQPAQIGV